LPFNSGRSNLEGTRFNLRKSKRLNSGRIGLFLGNATFRPGSHRMKIHGGERQNYTELLRVEVRIHGERRRGRGVQVR
jgi:hypothetical protein